VTVPPPPYRELLQVARSLQARAGGRGVAVNLDQADTNLLGSLRTGYARRGDHASAIQVGIKLLEGAVASVGVVSKSKQHADVVIAFVGVLKSAGDLAHVRTRPCARSMARDLAAGLGAIPKWFQDYIKNAPKALQPDALMALAGLRHDEWSALVADLAIAAQQAATPPATRLAQRGSAVELDVAGRLSRLADADAERVESQSSMPEYDRSENGLKLLRVEATGFRGSSTTVGLDLSRKGKPIDLLLWGDNGVGKSTIVDAIEFALQGRIDRSADFNSSLRSSPRNLQKPEAVARVTLDDGSVVERSLRKNEARRDVATSDPVRPGFRLAPVVIRRADILRFLDTEALSRGTVFFDYFPEPDGSIAMRPDELLNLDREEMFALRVTRDDLGRQLAEMYPDCLEDLTTAQGVDRLVETLLEEAPVDDVDDPLDSIPPDARALIGEQRQVQQRLKELKGRLERGVENLNPRANSRQLSRTMPAFHGISEDVTASFLEITGADHVRAIRVMVGKSGPVSLDVVVDFTNGTHALPQQVFSEGYRDLIALLFFLAVTKKAGQLGQAKVLVLDDALQSVDSGVRLGVMDHILTTFSDWQLIITGHDRAWLGQVSALYRARGRTYQEQVIRRWTFDDGLHLGGSAWTVADSVREALTRGDARVVAGTTGLLLEQICHELSWRLGVRIERKQDDRYTLGDLWPGLNKALAGTALADQAKKINLRVSIRNLLGAHYNEWADSISWRDIEELAESALAVYTATNCQTCNDWVKRRGPALACLCGSTRVGSR